jgi:hypothetical protein
MPAPPICPHAVVDPAGRGWLDREPTEDEQDILAYLKRRRAPKRILHIGVGTSLLFREFGGVVVQGLTKDGMEAQRAAELGYEAILCNKYDVPSYAGKIRGPFDVIVDVNIRSYACCESHFLEYMRFLEGSVAENGVLLTGQRGLAYLRPTTLVELRSLCSRWRVCLFGNVVVMSLKRNSWIRRLFGWAFGN